MIRRAWIAAQVRLDLVERARVDQVAKLLLAEQLAQEVAVEGQRLRPPLGRGRVVLVHVRGDVVEEERGRVRRGGLGLDVDDVDLPRAQAVQEILQRRQVDVVDVETASASPYSASLLFDYVATYMYEDDTPPAERRAQALSLDREDRKSTRLNSSHYGRSRMPSSA